jgi:hypothetical protein
VVCKRSCILNVDASEAKSPPDLIYDRYPVSSILASRHVCAAAPDWERADGEVVNVLNMAGDATPGEVSFEDCGVASEVRAFSVSLLSHPCPPHLWLGKF